MLLDIPSHGQELPGRGRPIGPGKYVVYHFLAKSLVRCTPDGEMLTRYNEMGYVFDHLADAQRYCQWKVKDNPKLGCTVYDDNRKFADQIFNADHLERGKRENAPKRQLLVGTLFLVCGCALIWIDSRHDWMLILGFMVGARLAVGGAAKILLSLGGLQRRRH